jgi:hypothetical protein
VLTRSPYNCCRNALAHPQLLVPVAIAAGGSAWNAADVGPDLQYVYTAPERRVEKLLAHL